MITNTPREQLAQYVQDLADGADVWCDRFKEIARTADGFCQFCGRTDHQPAVSTPDALVRRNPR